MSGKELFEKMWKLSIQKFEAKYGPLTEEDGAEYGKPFMYEAWQELVAPKLQSTEEEEGCGSECICRSAD
jgi:hypothetical protein